MLCHIQLSQALTTGGYAEAMYDSYAARFMTVQGFDGVVGVAVVRLRAETVAP